MSGLFLTLFFARDAHMYFYCLVARFAILWLGLPQLGMTVCVSIPLAT